MSKIQDIAGRSFGRLTAEERVGVDQNGISLWRCRCDCGNVTVVRLGSLKQGLSRSCGKHMREPRSRPGQAGFRHLLAAYRGNARRRDIEFLLTEDEFRELVTGACRYCGRPPSSVMRHTGRRVTEASKENSSFVYNGIDRVDSSKDYDTGNVVTCCATCNKAKLAMTLDEFIEWVRRVHSHLKLSN